MFPAVSVHLSTGDIVTNMSFPVSPLYFSMLWLVKNPKHNEGGLKKIQKKLIELLSRKKYTIQINRQVGY